jgi:Flp pilus assembly protein TadD
VAEKLPLFLIVIAVSVATIFAQEPALKSASEFPLLVRADNAIVTVWVYLRQMIWPVHLAVFYPHPRQLLPLWQVILSLTALIGVTTWVVRARERGPYLTVGWFWYLGMLVPVIGLIQVGWQAHADRYTYLPQVGILIMIAWGMTDLTAMFPRLKLPVRAAAGASILALILVAWRQVGYWSSSVTLWQHTLNVTTKNYVAERGVGTALLAIGRVDDAIAHDRAALQIRPNDTDSLTNLANALFKKGDLPEAIERFREVARLRPNDSEVRLNLGKALFANRAVDESIAECQAALRLRPNDPDAAYSLGKAIEIRPKDPASHYNLGIALQRAGQNEAAVAEFRETLRLSPRKVDARNNLAITLLKMDRTEDAIAAWQAALQIDPANAELHANLAVAYLNQNRIAEAVAQWHEALRLEPNKLPLQLTLAWILSTAPEDNVRNASEARQIAKSAFAAAADKNLMTYRVLAAAEAENGDFPSAMKIAREGIDQAVARDERTIAQLLELDLSLYDQSIPLRDPNHGRGGTETR